MGSLSVFKTSFILGIVFISKCSGYLVDDNPYRHFQTLDPQGKYQVEWLVDWEQERVTFNVTVATKGYVGLGLAKKGKMAGADIVIGGVGKNGKPYFSDRYAIGNQLPIVDPSQDWTLHSAREDGHYTYLSFSRPFDTCDADHDLPITNHLLDLIWAYGENDDPFQYHFQNRGSFPVYLLDPDLTPRSIDSTYRKSHPEEMKDLQVLPFTRHMRLPPQDTTYWCSFHKLPTRKKHHIVGFRTVFPTEKDRPHVHHLLLHRCRAPPGVDQVSFFEGATRTGGSECYVLDQPNPLPVPYCREVLHVWGVGGRAIFFPEHAGLPMSNIEDEYFMFQVHYDNPNEIANLPVTVTLEAYYTSNLRENEVGTLQLGNLQPASTTIFMPPGDPNHYVTGHCAPGCTERMFPPSGINLFAAFLHTHIRGTGVRQMHFRGNKELPWIQYDDNYDFNYQQFRVLREERKVMPGDALIARCAYDTTTANGSAVVGGFSTREEMCSIFMYYYSRSGGFALCRSEILDDEYKDRIGIRNVTWVQELRKQVITSPPQYRGLTVLDYANKHVDWSIEFRKQIQRDHLYMPQISQCPRFHWENAADQRRALASRGRPGRRIRPGGPIVGGLDGRDYTSVDTNFEHESTLPQGIPRWRPPPQCTRDAKRDGGSKKSRNYI